MSGKVGNSVGRQSLMRLDSFKACASSSNAKEEEVVEMSGQLMKNEELAVTAEDLEHLCQLAEVTDGGPT